MHYEKLPGIPGQIAPIAWARSGHSTASSDNGVVEEAGGAISEGRTMKPHGGRGLRLPATVTFAHDEPPGGAGNPGPADVVMGQQSDALKVADKVTVAGLVYSGPQLRSPGLGAVRLC